ncbi:MAG: hypothetical protein AAFU55_00325 [Pseudomonadota bacterium]
MLQLRLALKTMPDAIDLDGIGELDFIFLGPATDLYAKFFSVAENGLRLEMEATRARLKDRLTADGTLPIEPDALYVASVATHTQSLLRGASWTQAAPWWTNPEPPRPPMSRAVFNRCILRPNRFSFQFLSALKDLAGERCFVLDAPPVTRRYELFDLGYTAEDVKRLDADCRKAIRRRIAKIGLPIIGNPPGTLDDGFMKDQFLMPDERDRHHGNLDFSALVLSRLFDKERRGALLADGAPRET